MPFALLLALVPIFSGTLTTYLYDRDASLAARVCAGACTGMAALGLIGFVLASFFGLTPLVLVVACALTALPLLLLLKPEVRATIRSDFDETIRYVRDAILHPNSTSTVTVIFYALVVVLLWFVYVRAIFEQPDGIFTGVDNNLGDLPLHVGIVTGFVYGENLPPQHPEFAGTRLTYPFMVDFVTAMFVRAGASMESAMFWQNITLGVSLVGLVHRWALTLTRDRVAALLTPVLLLFSGGFGWWRLVEQAREKEGGLLGLLGELPHDYTITPDSVYRWGNSISTLFVPQRGFLFGLPLAIIIWTLWWQATDEDKGEKGEPVKTESPRVKNKRTAKKQQQRHGARYQRNPEPDSDSQIRQSISPLSTFPFSLSPSMLMMIAAGIVAGLLPLIHAHTFVVMMGMGGCLALLFPKRWRGWAAYFAVALLLALPQVYWVTRESATRPEHFFEWMYGWDRGEQHPVMFWLKNAGLFIPLLIAAILWRGQRPVVPKRLLLFFAPFVLCFIVPNLLRLSPWIWDNVKLLFYWYVAAVPLVALLLARLWRGRGWALRVVTLVLIILLTLAGGLDVWRIVSRASSPQVFDRDGIELAELIKRETPPRSRILHAPIYNHPAFLSGRRSLMGYDGHLWTHGIEYKYREADIKRIYAATESPESIAALLKSYGIEYIVVGPHERDILQVNEQFFERYPKVGEVGAYRLYKTTPQ